MHGEGIQSSLRCVIRKDFEAIDGRFRVGMQREGTKDAGQVHDAAFRSLLDKGQQRLRQLDGSKEVCVEGLAQNCLRSPNLHCLACQMASLETPALLMRISSRPKFLSK